MRLKRADQFWSFSRLPGPVCLGFIVGDTGTGLVLAEPSCHVLLLEC